MLKADRKLIRLVRSKPEIWNYRNKDNRTESSQHSNREMRKKAWDFIGEKMKLPATCVRIRWNNLRRTFRNELKKTLRMSGNPEPYVSSWKLFDSMLFLKEHMVKRKQSQSSSATLPTSSPEQNLQTVLDTPLHSPPSVSERGRSSLEVVWDSSLEPPREQSVQRPDQETACAGTAPERSHSSQSASVSREPKHPRMLGFQNRMLTYSCWPLSEPTPTQLAECGFFYTGVACEVTCFSCNATFKDWEPGDTPWDMHLMLFPGCTFLAMNRNKNGSSNPPTEPTSERLPAEAEIVERALRIFPEYLVKEAVKKKNGSSFSLEELCDTILELPREQNVPKPTLETVCPDPALRTDALLCQVCMDRDRGAVFQPCGHLVSCWSCASLVKNCPVCRKRISHKIKTYIS